MLSGKTILVTGGTGSFGNAFTQYVLEHYEPKKIFCCTAIIESRYPLVYSEVCFR